MKRHYERGIWVSRIEFVQIKFISMPSESFYRGWFRNFWLLQLGIWTFSFAGSVTWWSRVGSATWIRLHHWHRTIFSVRDSPFLCLARSKWSILHRGQRKVVLLGTRPAWFCFWLDSLYSRSSTSWCVWSCSQLLGQRTHPQIFLSLVNRYLCKWKWHSLQN